MSRFFLDLSQKEENISRIIIETFDDIVPEAVYNFRHLCTGEKKTFSSGIRLLKDSFLSVSENSIYSEEFKLEECTEIPRKLDEPWLISFLDSKFIINCDSLDTEAIVFGQIIKGTQVLKQILQDKSEEIQISHCGELIKKKKNATLFVADTKDKTIDTTETIDATETIDTTETVDLRDTKDTEDIKDTTESKDVKDSTDSEGVKDNQQEVDESSSVSSLEYPSVVLPDFKEPKSFLERGGMYPSSSSKRRRDSRDSQGRVVKGRGNFKYNLDHSSYKNDRRDSRNDSYSGRDSYDRRDSYRRDSYDKRDSYRRDSYRRDSYDKRDSYHRRDSYRRDSYDKRDSYHRREYEKR